MHHLLRALERPGHNNRSQRVLTHLIRRQAGEVVQVCIVFLGGGAAATTAGAIAESKAAATVKASAAAACQLPVMLLAAAAVPEGIGLRRARRRRPPV